MCGTFGRFNLDVSTIFASIRTLVRLKQCRVCISRMLDTRHDNNTMESVHTVSNNELIRQERLQRRRERERQQRAEETAEENTPEIS